jgi:hypothetical protein
MLGDDGGDECGTFSSEKIVVVELRGGLDEDASNG